MKLEKVTFKNREGQTLMGRLHLPPDKKPIAYAIFAHCFTCGKDVLAATNISRALSTAGVATLRFDFTGLGESEGDFSDATFASTVEDIESAADFMADNYSAADILIGHSLGGTAVLLAGNRIASVKTIITIGSPASPAHVTQLFSDNIDKIIEEGKAKVNIAGRTFMLKKKFIEELEQVNMEEEISNLEHPLLILHTPQDEVVDIDNARQIFMAAKHPKSFISLDGANHLLSNKRDSEFAANLIFMWAKRYINVPEEEPLRSDKRVAAFLEGAGFTTAIKAGNHGLISDEPTSFGGNDLGPTPYDLLVAGLGACTAMTVKMYAQRKKWPLEEVMVHLQHNKIHAEDCKNCDEKIVGLDEIERVMEFEGDLSDEQKKRLLDIAEKCPVHKTLENKVSIKTSLKI